MQIVAIGQTSPSGDELAIHSTVRFIAENQPDRVVFVRRVNHPVLASLREVFTGPIGVHDCSNTAVERFGVELLPEVSEFAPGWATKIDIAPERLGTYALTAAREAGISLVMGATQSMSICSFTALGYPVSVTGLEVGHLLQGRKVPNGQQGFMVLDVDGDSVAPNPVMIRKGECVRSATTGRTVLRTVDPYRAPLGGNKIQR